jgi:hypothetical protein
VHADAFGIGSGLLARDADGVFLGLNLQVLLIDARQLNDGEERIALLKDVDGREGTLACCLILQPIAGDAGLERSLQIEQGIEGVRKSCDHGRTHVLWSGATKMRYQVTPRGRSIW